MRTISYIAASGDTVYAIFDTDFGYAPAILQGAARLARVFPKASANGDGNSGLIAKRGLSIFLAWVILTSAWEILRQRVFRPW